MTDHTSSFDEDDDGWPIVRCTCGFTFGPVPDMETAADVWGDHQYQVALAAAAAERDRVEAERDGAVAYVREALERLALTAEVPIDDDDGPRANFRLVDDIEAELTRRYKALRRREPSAQPRPDEGDTFEQVGPLTIRTAPDGSQHAVASRHVTIPAPVCSTCDGEGMVDQFPFCYGTGPKKPCPDCARDPEETAGA